MLFSLLCLVDAQSSCCDFCELPLSTAFLGVFRAGAWPTQELISWAHKRSWSEEVLGSPTAARLSCAVRWGIRAKSQVLWWSPKSRQCLLWPESCGLKPADPMRSFYSKAQGTGTGGRNLGISPEQRKRYSMNPGSFPSASVRVSRDAVRYSEHSGGQPTQRRYGWPWTSLTGFQGSSWIQQ